MWKRRAREVEPGTKLDQWTKKRTSDNELDEIDQKSLWKLRRENSDDGDKEIGMVLVAAIR